MEEKKIWYAVQPNEDDEDWGDGSYDLREAVEMAVEKELGEGGIIAIVDVTSGYNHGERIGIYTMDEINRMHELRKKRIAQLAKKFDEDEEKYKDNELGLRMTRIQRKTLTGKKKRSEYHTYRVHYSIYENGKLVDHPLYGQIRPTGNWVENPEGEYIVKAEDEEEAKAYCKEYLERTNGSAPVVYETVKID